MFPVSLPTVAVPLLKLGVKLIAVVLALDRLTVKFAKAEASLTVTLLTLRVGVSSSRPVLLDTGVPPDSVPS